MSISKSFLTPIYNKSLVQNIIDRITNAILNNELKPGDKLPTETELAHDFNVGRNSIREAVSILVSYGVLEIKRADGTFVCQDFSPKIINPMLYGILLKKESYGNLIELRRLIESGILTIVVRRGISDVQKNKLKTKLYELNDSLTSQPYNIQEIIDKDVALHDFIANCTENDLLVQVYGFVVSLTISSRLKTVAKIIEKNDIKYLIHAHEEIVKIIIEQDINNLDKVINESYKYWADVYN